MKRGGGWTIVYRTNGKQKWEGGFETKEAARRRLDEVLKLVSEKRHVDRDVAFADFTREWMEQAKGTLKPKTWGSYDSMLRLRITPTFGTYFLRDVTCALVASWVGALQCDRTLGRKTVKNIFRLLHVIFESAMISDLVPFNPCHKIKFAKDRHIDQPMPTTDEVARTFAKLPRVYQALLLTGAVTGFRRAELLGLRWDDVDWKKSALYVRRTLQRIKRSQLEADSFRDVERIGKTSLALVTPKSDSAMRRVEIEPDLLAVLHDERERSTGPFVFEREIGGPIDPDGVYDVLYAAQDAAGVPRFGLHGLRRLYCSLLVESGANVKFAQKKMGHASATTTLDDYARVVTDQDRACAEKIAANFPCVSGLLAGRPEQEKRPSA